MDFNHIPEYLKKARRALDALKEVKLLQDWTWDKYVEKWYLKISITITYDTELLPKTSYWYMVVSASYPRGEIKVYPDINNSLVLTLQHQANNSEIETNNLWRKGSLCLDNNTSGLNRNRFDLEPLDADSRLCWHARRAIDWINSAIRGELTVKGDLFELPAFANYSSKIFVFAEDTVTYMQWESIDEYYGFADLFVIKNNPNIYFVKSFNSINGTQTNSIRWGNYLSNKDIQTHSIAAWIMLKSIPVLNVWQPPYLFQNLIEVCLKQEIDLLELLRRLLPKFRDGLRHLLLFGFPIPKKIGEENEIIVWQALQLPLLSYGKQTANGFRTNENGRWIKDRNESINNSMKLQWVESQNWEQNQISSRGRLSNDLVRDKVLLLGSGCIGSAVAEILVRAGVYNMSIMDNDILEVGNLCRHTLSIKEVFNDKATGLAERLNQLNPYAEINVIHDKLRLKNENELSFDLNPYSLIIDCTGSDTVFEALSKIEFKKNKIFASISISLKAKNIFIALYNDMKFDFSSFYKTVEEFIHNDTLGINFNDLPRDGIGCWHPTFPARSEDIWLAAGMSVKALEKFIISNAHNKEILVYEQNYKGEDFNGYNIAVRVCE